MKNHGTWHPTDPFDYAIWRVREEDGKHWYDFIRNNPDWPIVDGDDTSGTMKFTFNTDGNYVSGHGSNITGLGVPNNFVLFELEPGDTLPPNGTTGTVVDGVFVSDN